MSSGRRWRMFETFEIPHHDRPGENYLKRWILVATPFFEIYVHRIYTPDMAPILHDHPWAFLAFVPWGSYVERVPSVDGIPGHYTKTRKIRWFNFKSATDAHYIESVTPHLWTLIVTGPRCRTWGYYENEEDDDKYEPAKWTAYDQHPLFAKGQEAKGRA